MGRQGITCTAVAVLWLLSLATRYPAEGVESYLDDFEEDPTLRGWEAPNPPATQWDQTVAFSGQHSLKITARPGEVIGWACRCNIPVKRNVKYRLAIRIKFENVLDHYGARFAVSLPKGEGIGLGWLCGNDGWREFYRYFTPRESDVISGFRVSVAADNDLEAGYELGPMTAYFDDLTVTQTEVDMSAVPRSPQADSAFETRAYSNHGFREVRDRFRAAVASGNHGWITAELERANRQLMDEEFYPDGGQVESSPHYHMVTMRSAMTMVDVARRNGIELPQGFTERLPGQITDFFVQTLTPQLRIPLVGDNGGDHIDDVNTMCSLFGRADTRWVWTGRKEGSPPAAKSVAFPDSGFYIMRTGWEPDAHYLLFRCIDHRGFAVDHFHRDQLSFLLYAYGHPIILERGGWGDRHKRTEFHNTIMLDGHQQNLLEATCHAWASNADIDFVDGSHPGYREATCRRRIFFVKPQDGLEGYWVISDLVTGAATRNVRQFLHLDPAIELSSSPDRQVLYATSKPGKAHLVPVAPSRTNSYVDDVPLENTPRSGVAILLRDFNGRPCLWQTEPGKLFIVEEASDGRSPKTFDLPTQVLTWDYQGALPVGSHEVFYPFRDRDRKPTNLRVEPVRITGAGGASDPAADGLRVVIGDTEDVFLFAPGPGARRCGDVTFEGTAGYVRFKAGTVVRHCGIGGTLKVGG
jgi:hypothetical protein